MRGIVKCFDADRGWGAIVSPEVDGDVWVHFSVIGDRFGSLDPGDLVEFDVETAQQDGFRFRATRARRLSAGPAPTLRRHGDRVDIVPDGTPHTPPTPKRPRPLR